ncbi:hypothetical protein AB0K00_57225 [Dactylosporangium sp. NPDC049525]|uniref:hypothetical protein n=1 Tax=Dactylosporangium sp. NPDC049525 TaxID=3154730 RepID=UPI00343F7C06
MNTNGLLHFDAHFGNILTDGRRLYLADLGLATSTQFDLAPDGRDLITQNLSHDACITMTELVNWLVTHVVAVADLATGGPVERNAYIRRCAAGARPTGVPASIATLISPAPAVVVINEFYGGLFRSRTTPYPGTRSQGDRADPRLRVRPAASRARRNWAASGRQAARNMWSDPDWALGARSATGHARSPSGTQPCRDPGKDIPCARSACAPRSPRP